MKRFVLSLALILGAAGAQTTTPAPAPAAPATTPAPVAPAAPAAPALDPGTVVATVGGQAVTLAEFDKYFQQYVARAANAQGVPYSADIVPYFAQYRPDILKQYARQVAILQVAKASGASADPKTVDERISTAKGGFKDEAEFQDALTQSGIGSEADYRSLLSDSLIVNAYLDGVRGRFKFGDSVVAGYYQGNKAKFTQGAQACAKHILVPDEAAAKAAKDRLDKGEDFAAVAGAVSQDPGSKDQGGDLGCIEPGVTVPEFDKAIFSGPLNQLQQVKTQFGVHLIVVSKRTPAGVTPLADARPKIIAALTDEAAQKYLNSQVAKVKTEVMADKVAAPAPAAPAPSAPSDTPAEPAPAPAPGN